MVVELARRDATGRDFLMRVTHDLRTPLTAIRGHAAALADGVVPEDEAPRSLHAIESEALRLERLVGDLLDLARLDAHRFRLELSEIDPADVLQQAFATFSAQAAQRGVSYEQVLEPLPAVVTDGARVGQIVANLLDNALRWTPAGGTVRMQAREAAEGGVVVTVADTGTGIPADELEAVFEPFRSQEPREGRQGTGLGLAISRQLARALGGDLTVESGPGAGSRFTLVLPARSVQLPEPAPVGG
jgi:two-component system sensor histidine kinase BaeS